MRIAMVSEHASPLAVLGGVDAGGQNVHVGALAEALVRCGHDVVVHTRSDDPRSPPQVRTAGGVTVHHVEAGPPRPLPKDDLAPLMGEFGRHLRRHWADDRPEVVHAHFWMSGMAAVDAARPLQIPVLQTFHALGVVKRRHQGSADTSPAWRLDAERRLVGTVDHVVATCRDEAAELDRLGADPDRVTVIPCGVDPAVFRPAGPRATRSARTRLLVVGRLVERKRVDDVIVALGALPDTELLVAGGPPADELGTDPDVVRLRAVAGAAGVGDRVRFLGRVGRSELPALLRSADAVVSVPAYEPFGIVPLEAMACGVPVVVSAVGGLTESVVDGITGFHVAPGEPDRLAQVVRRLLDSPGLGARLGAAGVRRVEAHYTWDGIARSTAELYRRVARRSDLSRAGAE